MNFRRYIVSSLIIAMIAILLWAPFVSLGVACLQVLADEPQRLTEIVPTRGVARMMFWNSLQLSFLTVVFALIFGAIAALAIARANSKWRVWALAATVLPLALPPTLGATAWLEWTRTPPFRAVASLGATRGESGLWWSQILVASVVLAGCFYPVVALPLANALRTMGRETGDAARLFGAPWQAWREVWWPQIAPTMGASCGVVAVLALWEMGAADLLDVRTYSVQIYRDLSAPDALDPNGKAVKAALAGLPLLGLSVGALWPLWRARQQSFSQHFVTEANTFKLHRAFTILALVLWAFSPGAAIGVWLSQLEIGVFARVWRANATEIGNSALLCFAGTLVILLGAMAIVGLWRDWPARWRLAARWILTLPLLIAPILVGVALIGWYNRPGWDAIYAGWSSPFGVWDEIGAFAGRYAMMLVGYATRFGPLTLWLLDAFDARCARSGEDAARNLGASGWQSWRDVTWKTWRPVVAGIAVVVWALCAGELSVSVLINAPGGQTLPVPVFNLMHIGAKSEVAALSLTLLAIAALPLIAAIFLARRPKL